MVALGNKLRRYPGQRAQAVAPGHIGQELEAQGYVNERGKVFNPKSIASMLGRIG